MRRSHRSSSSSCGWKWLGYRREDIIGHTRFRDLLIPQNARRFDEIFPRFVAQGSIHDLELNLVRKDGSLLPVSLSATAIRNSEGRFIASRSTIVDITERRRTEEVLRQAHDALETQVRDRTAELAIANRRLEEQLEESRRTEEALRVSESRFRLTADYAPVLIWISDSAKACTWFNKPWLEFVGRRMEQEIGNGWVDNVHPDDVARCIGIYTDSFDARREFTMEYRLRRHDGAWRWILDHGIPRYEGDGSFAGYIGSCTDIHDRKRAEEIQSRLAAIVESSNDAIVSASLDGTVRTWNEGAQRMFGYGADEMVGRSIRTIIPADRHAEETGIFERVGRGERIEEYETIRIRKDGTVLDVSLTASPVRDSQGNVIGVAKIVRDITTRKRTEAALRQKSQLIELSHEPIFSWDVDGGIIEWNQGCEQLYGFTRAEAMSRRCHDLLNTVFPEPLHDIMMKVTRTGEWTGELLQRTKDRREVIVESRWGSTEQSGRRIMLETNRDITERKRAEEALRDSREQLANDLAATRQLQAVSMELIREDNTEVIHDRILDAAMDIMCSDFASMQIFYPERGEGGELRLLACRGFTPHAAKFGEWVPVDSNSTCGRVLCTGQRVIAPDVERDGFMVGTDDLATYLQIGIHAFQTTPLISRTGRIVGMISTHWCKSHQPSERDLRLFDVLARQAADLIERRQAEKSIRESEERFRAFIKATSDVVYRMSADWTEMRYLQGREFIADTLEPSQTWLNKYIHPADQQHVLETIQRAILAKSVFELEHRVVRVDGSLGWTYSRAIPIFDDRGEIVEWFGAASDVTPRKNAETVLINKNKDLETLLYVTSHDLKEPLRSIESFSQLVLERYADRIDKNGGDYLRRVVRATQRLDRLLNDILELSRAQRMLPPMEEVEAEVLVKEALTRLDNRIQETGAAVRIISPLPRLRVNRMWATQGLYNLLANAMKFTHNGHAPDIEIASYEAPASATPVAGVMVKDRGPGVPTRHAERIFMLFQRAVGRNVEGTGAGLTIVRQVAERHGGRAWVQPRPGGGSEFVITFACPTHNKNGGASPT